MIFIFRHLQEGELTAFEIANDKKGDDYTSERDVSWLNVDFSLAGFNPFT